MLLAVIDNAVKFTPPGRTVRMGLTGRTVTISDEGVGIAQAEIPHIFDRFHHTRDASRESTGLGLTITREIALRHGIAIDVRSREGEGTTFSFTFPEQNA